MATDTKYNGYTNYETWVVALWIDNDQGAQEWWQSQAQDCWVATDETADQPDRVNEATNALSQQLKSDHEERSPETEGVFADLLNAALSEVDWYDIAENMIAEVIADAEKSA